MARGFSATLGAGASDRVLTTYNAKPTLRSFSVWTYRNGDGGGTAGRIFDDGGTAVEALRNNGTTYEYVRAWSGGLATWAIARPSGSAWHHTGVTYNGSSTGNSPLMYLDGTSQTVTPGTAVSGTLSTSAQFISIGNRGQEDRAWDGMLAEFAAWDRILTADEMAALAKGASPLFFKNGLVEYIPLVRNNVSRKLAPPSLTGTAIQPHPRVIYPSQVFWPYPPVPANVSITVPLATLQYTTYLPTIISDGEYVPPAPSTGRRRHARWPALRFPALSR